MYTAPPKKTPNTHTHPLQVRQLFNPDYGMFTSDPASHLHWFRPAGKLAAEDMELEFELVGILIGEYPHPF